MVFGRFYWCPAVWSASFRSTSRHFKSHQIDWYVADYFYKSVKFQNWSSFDSKYSSIRCFRYFKPQDRFISFKELPGLEHPVNVNPSEEFVIPINCGILILDLQRDPSRGLDIFCKFSILQFRNLEKHKS